MFANISRHPSKRWPNDQKQAASEISPDGLVNIAFPRVPPEDSTESVRKTAQKIASTIGNGVTAAMVQGEYTLTLFLAEELARRGIDVYVACLKDDYQKHNGHRARRFVQFRKIAEGRVQ